MVRRSNQPQSQFLPPRRHKGIVFYPTYPTYSTKQEAYRFLRGKTGKPKKRWGSPPEKKRAKVSTAIGNRKYYRIYEHKHKGYVVYVSEKEKLRWSGVRKGRRKGYYMYKR